MFKSSHQFSYVWVKLVKKEPYIRPSTFDHFLGHTAIILSCRLNYHLSDISAIKQHLMTKYDKDTDKLKSLDIRKILINNTKIMYKNNNNYKN